MKFWRPGEPLTERDHTLLAPLKARARELGRTPTTAETPNPVALKARFRIWKNAVLAAELPALNDPEQVRLREAERAKSPTD